ncbi:vitamin B12 ABC transporter permease BtuC [Escherichia coli O25b:H4-ST131]|uniref:vitamin B12 ABC transporter permease BtuC n=1 Tax=Escherichia coli TaxID=562 RepID=UPI00190E6043|nr:vitamin B12 ABC transporter permease BtuC [Escherichia coli]MBK0720041.1 vitamin B12 ABC transporter permease BtuC [Escherichia coli O25b:H4-ST131]
MLTLARQQQRQNIRWLLCLSVLMLLALLLSLCAGEQWISPGDWFTPRGELFVWQIRLPRTLAVLLAGVALGIICSALMTWAIYFSTSVDLRQLMYWMMGGFGGVDWRQSWLMLALIPVLLWICCQSRPVNMLALGEISARQLGLPLWFWRNVLVAATGWMVGVSVALAGAIGFIGLVIPHILRLCGLTDHRVLLPGCALAGASALLLADIVARLALAAAELPIGVVTATLGAPVFIWLLLKAGR